MYLLSGVLTVDRAFGNEPPNPVERRRRATLLGRWLTATFGAATIGLVFLAGRELAGPRAALLAATFFALAPVPAIDSRYANVNVAMAFWATASFWALLRWQHRGGMRNFLFGAACIGFAGASKYNGLALFATVPVVVALRISPRHHASRALRACGAAALVCLAAFAMGTPYTVLGYESFLEQISQEVAHQTQGHLGADVTAGVGAYRPVVHQFLAGLPLTLGLPGYLLGLVGCALLARRGVAASLLFATAVLVLFVPVAATNVVFVRYLIPLAPFLSLSAGLAADSLLAARSAPTRWIGRGVVAVAIGYTAALSADIARQMKPLPTERASAWLDRHVAAGEVVQVTLDAQFYVFSDDDRFRVRPVSLEAIASAKATTRWLVLGCWMERALQRAPLQESAEADFVRELGTDASDYAERARFELDYFARDFYAGLDPTFANYPLPGVVIYERRRSSESSPHRAAP